MYRFHDGYITSGTDLPTIKMIHMGYSLAWLNSTGYFLNRGHGGTVAQLEYGCMMVMGMVMVVVVEYQCIDDACILVMIVSATSVHPQTKG
jgi:hypothetical protein